MRHPALDGQISVERHAPAVEFHTKLHEVKLKVPLHHPAGTGSSSRLNHQQAVSNAKSCKTMSATAVQALLLRANQGATCPRCLASPLPQTSWQRLCAHDSRQACRASLMLWQQRIANIVADSNSRQMQQTSAKCIWIVPFQDCFSQAIQSLLNAHRAAAASGCQGDILIRPANQDAAVLAWDSRQGRSIRKHAAAVQAVCLCAEALKTVTS